MADTGGIGVLTKDAGPIPVWGWLAVGVAVIFLYRKMAGPATASTSSTAAAQPTPSGTAIVITPDMLGAAPGQNTVGASATPSGSTLPQNVQLQSQQIAQQSLDAGAQPGVGASFLQAVASSSPAVQGFFTSIAQSPEFQTDPLAVEQFFAQDAALKQLGEPYYQGNQIINPQTGQSITAPAGAPAYWLAGGPQLPPGWAH